ncbi:MAG: hypothetical protein ACKVOH_04855 [Chlamydiales bacterium]
MRRRIFLILFTLVSAFTTGYFGLQLAFSGLNDTFSLANITSDLSYAPCFETTPLTKIVRSEVEKAFDQSYFYLCKGSQCYVFESADKKYVLKFFRHNRFRFPVCLGKIPLPSFLSEIHNRRSIDKSKKLHALFCSCRLAYEYLREESALLYMHLNKSKNLQKEILIYDTLNRPYSISLDDFEFYLQRKVEPLNSYITSLHHNGHDEKIPLCLQKMTLLLLSRLEKGIDDHDPVLQKNTGFVDERVVFLDIGSFYFNEAVKDPDSYHGQVYYMTRKLKRWLEERAPASSPFVDEAIEILL